MFGIGQRVFRLKIAILYLIKNSVTRQKQLTGSFSPILRFRISSDEYSKKKKKKYTIILLLFRFLCGLSKTQYSQFPSKNCIAIVSSHLLFNPNTMRETIILYLYVYAYEFDANLYSTNEFYSYNKLLI